MSTGASVFLSSTREDLYQYRDRAREVIRELGLQCISMEGQPQTGFGEAPAQISVDWVRQSEWFVLVLGWNYGTVPPGQSISITQQEYEYAKSIKPMRCFVYFAGDKNDPVCGYAREAGSQEIDLLKYEKKASKEMLKFRATIKQTFAKPFRNISDFGTQLHADLKFAMQTEDDRANAVQAELQKALLEFKRLVQHNAALRQWMNDMRPIYCLLIRQVVALADFKEIHATLHRLRQQYIRPMNEVVLPEWKGAQLKKINRFINVTNRRAFQLGELKGKIKKVDEPAVPCFWPDIDFDMLDQVLAHTAVREETDDDIPKKQEIILELDEFSRAVQAPFSMMNSAMQRHRETYLTQTSRIKESMNDRLPSLGLDREGKAKLGMQFETLANFGFHLTTILKHHDEWQNLHDILVGVDEAESDVKRYPTLVKTFLRTSAGRLDKALVNSEPVLRSDPDRVITCSTKEAKAFLKYAQETLAALRELTRESCNGGAPASTLGDDLLVRFKVMRQKFDDAFFYFDETVLAIVNRGRLRAEQASNQLLQLQPAAPAV